MESIDHIRQIAGLPVTSEPTLPLLSGLKSDMPYLFPNPILNSPSHFPLVSGTHSLYLLPVSTERVPFAVPREDTNDGITDPLLEV